MRKSEVIVVGAGIAGLTSAAILSKKGLEDNWIDCFLNLRIIPQLLSLKARILDKEIINKVKEKIKSELLHHKPINALVHGDLWSGNAGMDKNGRAVSYTHLTLPTKRIV